jgi:hypothetical protein
MVNAKKNPIGVNMNRLQELMNQYKQHPQNPSDLPFESDRQSMPVDDDESGIDANERRMLKVLQFCLLAAMAYFCFENVRPYISLVDAWLFNWQDTGIFAMVAGLPVLGWILTGGISLTSFVIALLLWASLQLLELLPSFMMDSPRFLLSSLNSLRSWKRIKGEAGDTPLSKKLKQQYNAIPEQAIERANVARAVAYLIDALICIAYYQPIEGGLSNLGLVIGAGAWDYIDWSKVVAVASTLFAVEAIYWTYKLVIGIATTHFKNN